MRFVISAIVLFSLGCSNHQKIPEDLHGKYQGFSSQEHLGVIVEAQRILLHSEIKGPENGEKTRTDYQLPIISDQEEIPNALLMRRSGVYVFPHQDQKVQGTRSHQRPPTQFWYDLTAAPPSKTPEHLDAFFIVFDPSESGTRENERGGSFELRIQKLWYLRYFFSDKKVKMERVESPSLTGVFEGSLGNIQRMLVTVGGNFDVIQVFSDKENKNILRPGVNFALGQSFVAPGAEYFESVPEGYDRLSFVLSVDPQTYDSIFINPLGWEGHVFNAIRNRDEIATQFSDPEKIHIVFGVWAKDVSDVKALFDGVEARSLSDFGGTFDYLYKIRSGPHDAGSDRVSIKTIWFHFPKESKSVISINEKEFKAN